MMGFDLRIRVVFAFASVILAVESHAQTIHDNVFDRSTSPVMGDERSPALLITAGLAPVNRPVGRHFLKTAETKTAADCPPNYPQSLPCIAEGTLVYEEPSTGPRFPAILVLGYQTDMDTLYTELENAAEAGGWAIESSEIGVESDGRRYRAQLRKAGELVGVSIYNDSQGMARMQLMLWPVKEIRP